MDWYAPVVKHLIHPLWAFKDGEKHLAVLRDLERWQYLDPEALREHQLKRIREITVHAGNTSPYYRELFRTHGIEPMEIRSFEDFRKIPLLAKEDIQRHEKSMASTAFSLEQLFPDKTGGSTGKPISYYRDYPRRDMQKAAAIRHDRWAHQDIGDKIAVIWGHREDVALMSRLKARLTNAVLDRRCYLDASSMTEHDLSAFLRKMKTFRPDGFLGYANALYQAALFMEEKGLSLPNDIKSVISSAEMLHPHERELIEQAFGARVFDRYGCREFGPIASECETHEGLHMAADYLYIEFLDERGEPVPDGEAGNIVITDLFNRGMPFIRYRIEDVGMPLNGRCECGRTLPRMDKLAGRVTDFLITPEGVRVSGASVTIGLIANIPGLAQAQFIQETAGALRMKVVRRESFNEDSAAFLRRELSRYFGSSMQIDIEYVDSIPKEPSGKFRFSICRINNGAHPSEGHRTRAAGARGE